MTQIHSSDGRAHTSETVVDGLPMFGYVAAQIIEKSSYSLERPDERKAAAQLAGELAVQDEVDLFAKLDEVDRMQAEVDEMVALADSQS